MSNRSPSALVDSVSRAPESAQGGVGPGEPAWRSVFGIPKPVERLCDGHSGGDCPVCTEIARVQAVAE